MTVRKILHRLGYRFRIHNKDLPGKPDICLPKYKTVVMVHGCFWHNHKKCRDGKIPKSNADYWQPKIFGNVARDKKHRNSLRKLGWKVLTLWECELKDPSKLEVKLRRNIKL